MHACLFSLACAGYFGISVDSRSLQGCTFLASYVLTSALAPSVQAVGPDFAFGWIMIDCSKAEMAAIGRLVLKGLAAGFLLCKFHFLQSIEQFCKTAGSGVHGKEGQLSRLRIYGHIIALQVGSGGVFALMLVPHGAHVQFWQGACVAWVGGMLPPHAGLPLGAAQKHTCGTFFYFLVLSTQTCLSYS